MMYSGCAGNSLRHATSLVALITVGRVNIGLRFLLLANVMSVADTSFVAVGDLLCC